MLTTSAYGAVPTTTAEDVDPHRRPADAGGRGCAGQTASTRCSTPTPTRAGRTRSAKVIVPEPLAVAWAPFARSRGAARCTGERRFDCVITTSPPESAHAVGLRAAARAGCRWVADVRDAWTFEPLRPAVPDRAPAAPRRAPGAPLARRRRRGRLRQPSPAADDLRRRGIAEPLLIPNGWDPDVAPARPPARSRPACSTPSASRSSTRAASAATAATRGRWSRRSRALARADPEAAARLELVIAGPLTEEEAALFATDVAPARDRRSPAASPRERALALQREADALLLIAQPTRRQLLNIKLFEYLAAGPPDPRARRRHRGRADRRREIGARGPSAPTTRPRSPRRWRGSSPASSPRPSADAVAPYTYPAPAEAHGRRGRGGDRARGLSKPTVLARP